MVDSNAPIIIKRIKKSAAGHHGGSWKVAYADFVTAMMAFFLLLWLINVTTADQKKGISDYFTPTIGIKDAKGIGFSGGKISSPKKGTAINNMTAPGLVIGQVQQGPVAKEPKENTKPGDSDAEEVTSGKKDKPGGQDNAQETQDNLDSDTFKLAADEIRQALEKDKDLEQYKNNVEMEEHPDGLKIDLIDDPKQPMFTAGGAQLTDGGKKALDAMANIIVKTPNQIKIVGHTDAGGPPANPRYTNWELSADRANAARRALVTTQVEPERVSQVIGVADHELLIPKEPNNPRNRRVSIVLLRGTYFRDPKSQVNNRPILSVPEAKVKDESPIPEAKPEPEKPAGPSIFDDAGSKTKTE